MPKELFEILLAYGWRIGPYGAPAINKKVRQRRTIDALWVSEFGSSLAIIQLLINQAELTEPLFIQVNNSSPANAHLWFIIGLWRPVQITSLRLDRETVQIKIANNNIAKKVCTCAHSFAVDKSHTPTITHSFGSPNPPFYNKHWNHLSSCNETLSWSATQLTNHNGRTIYVLLDKFQGTLRPSDRKFSPCESGWDLVSNHDNRGSQWHPLRPTLAKVLFVWSTSPLFALNS